MYLCDGAGGICASRCQYVDTYYCESEVAGKIDERFFFTGEETCYAGKVQFVFDDREEKAWDDDADCEIENADGANAGSHQGNSNGAGGV